MKKTLFRRAAAFVTALAAALSLAACGRTEQPEPTPQGPVTLTLATLSGNRVDWEAVKVFNDSHADVRIEVADYSEYDTQESSGLERLMTDIAAGDVPDILEVGSESAGGPVPYRRLAAQGLLEDLWPYIEADSDLGRESLMEAPLKAAQIDGALYLAFRNANVFTAAGSAERVGDRYSWTISQLLEALAAMPEGSTAMGIAATSGSVLEDLMYMCLDNFVDWESGQCRFDSEEFAALLSFCGQFPLEFDPGEDMTEFTEKDTANMAQGRQLLDTAIVSRFQDLQMYDTIFGGRASFIGCPMEDGSPGSAFFIQGTMLAMSASCPDKQAAWDYIRTLFLPQYADWSTPELVMDVYDLPVNKEDFERLAQAVSTGLYSYTIIDGGAAKVTKNKDGSKEPLKWRWGVNYGEYHNMTGEEYGRFMDWYSQVDKLYKIDNELFQIVRDSAQGYFHAERSLEDTARLIQGKALIYVNERR